MTRITYWLLSTLSAVVLLFGFDASRHGTATTPGTTTPFVSAPAAGSSASGRSHSGTSDRAGSRTPSSRAPSASSSASSPTRASATTTGSAVSTIWGPVQVQVISRGATITQVKVLQYPNGTSRDVQIADYALPILVNETIKNQSARIDMVSGATYTSDGYIRSLQSALDQAHL